MELIQNALGFDILTSYLDGDDVTKIGCNPLVVTCEGRVDVKCEEDVTLAVE